MARTAHNRRLHRKKVREDRPARPQAFVPVADDMMRSARENEELMADEAYPEERVREAGLSSAAQLPQTVDNEPTPDDASPETLLSDQASRLVDGPDSRAADASLREVDESEIGEGLGLDEAEEAQRRPLDGSGKTPLARRATRRRPRDG